MRIATVRDVDADPAVTYAALTDFDAVEARFRERGIAIERLDPVIAPGTRWRGGAEVAGRRIAVEAVLAALEPGVGWRLEALGEGLAVTAAARLLPAARGTRVEVAIDVAPASMRGRLALQPLKLARGRLEAKLRQFVDAYAAGIESPRSGV